MSDFTFEYRESKGDCLNIYEKYEWDNIWIEYANTANKRRIAYIGDSISCGIRELITKRTNEEILCDGFGTSKAVDNPFFEKGIELFAAQLPEVTDIIFNNGLHGWHLSEDEFERYYDAKVAFMKRKFSSARLFIVLTTALLDKKKNERVILRNEAALRVAKKYNLPVIDLYSITLANPDKYLNDGIHLKNELYETLADEIISNI